jgi:hypothetical protein
MANMRGTVFDDLTQYHSTGVANPYGELLTGNSFFTTYLQLIFELQDRGISKPADILHKLLAKYRNFCEDPGLVYAASRLWSIPAMPGFATRLQNAIADKDSNELLSQLNALTTLQYINEPRFNELFGAFYSVYPLFLERLSDCEFKRKLVIKKIDDIYFTNVIQHYAKSISKGLHALYDDTLKVVIAAGEIPALTTYYAGLLAAQDRSLTTYPKSLIQLAEHLSGDALKENFLPPLLKMLAEESAGLRGLFPLLNLIIRKIDIETTLEKILPLLTRLVANEPDNRMLYGCAQALAVIGNKLTPEQATLKIAPILLEVLSGNIVRQKWAVYEAFIHLLLNLPRSYILIQLVPHLKKDIVSSYDLTGTLDVLAYTAESKLHGTIISLIEVLLVANSEEHSEEINSQYIMILNPLIAAASHKFNKIMPKLGSPEQTVAKISQECSQYARILDANTITNTILPYLKKRLAQPDSDRSQDTTYETFAYLAQMPETLITNDKKQESLVLLLALIPVDELDRLQYYTALAYLTPFITEVAVLKKLTDHLLSIMNLRVITPVHGMVVETMSAVMKLSNSATYNDVLWPQLLNCDFDHFSNEVCKLYTLVMDVTTKEKLIENLVPKLIASTVINDKVAKLIEHIIPRLDYEERVYLTRNILARLESSPQATSFASRLLTDIHTINARETEQFIKNRQEQASPTALSLTILPSP